MSGRGLRTGLAVAVVAVVLAGLSVVLLPSATSAATVDLGAWYVLVNRNSGKAMDDYKRRSGRMFPTWSEVLEVIRDLGYRKVAERSQTYEAVPVAAHAD